MVVALGPIVGYLFGAAAEPWLTVAAYVLVALAFQPLRRVVDRLADRAVYGARAAPYESLVEFGARLADTPDGTALLAVVAESCTRAVDAAGAEVRVRLAGGDATPSASGEYRAADVAGAGRGADVTVAISYASSTIGHITVHLKPRQSLRPADRALLRELADRAGAAFHNVALAEELQARASLLRDQADELIESRRRLTAAADSERELIAAGISTQVAGPLSVLPSALAALGTGSGSAPDAVGSQAATLRAVTESALVSLRQITGGVHPPLLTRRGLAAALDGLAARSVRSPVLDVPVELADRRFDPAIEGTGYFCCRWAVETLIAGPPAHISVALPPGRLRFTLVGTATAELSAVPRWQQVRDRVDAVGGTVDWSDDGSGRLAIAVNLPAVDDPPAAQLGGPDRASSIPAGAGRPADSSDQRAASRSGPNRDFSR